MGPERISQGAWICAGTIAPGCRKQRLALLVSAPLGSRSCQAGRNYEIRGFCAASCCIIPILLHPPPQLGSRGGGDRSWGRGGLWGAKVGRGISQATNLPALVRGNYHSTQSLHNNSACSRTVCVAFSCLSGG